MTDGAKASADKYGNGKLGLYDPRVHIFVDMREVRCMHRIHLRWAEPTKRADPVLYPEKPWEGNRVQGGSVILDEESGKFRCWYVSIRPDGGVNDKMRICYAESSDGINWDRPDLGLHDWQGSKKNNICLTPQGNLDVQVPIVVRDEDEPDPEARYKLVAYMQDERMYAQPELWAIDNYLFTSPDGIHWRVPGRNVNLRSLSDRFWLARDQKRKLWIGMVGPYPGDTGGAIRLSALKTSTDLENWSEPFIPFKMDEREGYGSIFDHHTLYPFLYGDQYLGYFDTHGSYYAQINEVVSSHDGEHWERPMRDRSFYRLGPDRAWDSAGLFPFANPPIPVGDELYCYYHGSNGYVGGMGLCTIRRDGFVGLTSISKSREPGWVLTEPVEVLGENLYVNAAIYGYGRGEIKVSVNTWENQQAEGYQLAQCKPVTGDGIRLKVEWEGKHGLREFLGKKVLLRFEIQHATLYAYAFGS